MDGALYVASSGADQIMAAQTVSINNLANSQTTGFKSDLAEFFSQGVYGDGVQSRAYAMAEDQSADFSAGSMASTGRELDVAIKGDGWIAVETASGEEAMTRAGDLVVSAEGLLVTGRGEAVLGNGGPIAIPPYESLDIGSDGVISIRPAGQGPDALAILDRIKLVNPPLTDIKKGADGLFHMNEPDQVAEADANVRLASGVLEGSNVRPMSEMVKIIDLSRQYESTMKLMKLVETNDESSAQIMQVS